MPHPVTYERIPAQAWCQIPEHCLRPLRRYIVEHCPVGDFLQAVLKNDLREAFMRADDVNFRAVGNYVRFLYNYAPSPCWGSPAAYEAWIAAGVGAAPSPDDLRDTLIDIAMSAREAAKIEFVEGGPEEEEEGDDDYGPDTQESQD